MFNELITFIRNWYQTTDLIPLHEPRFGALELEYVTQAINSTFVSSVSEFVNRFERELARHVGAKHAVATVNGTAALQVALQLAGVKSGDEVITQPLTFVATANAIAYNNAHPVFVDVDQDTMGLSPEALEMFFNRFAKKRNGQVINHSSGRRIAAIVPMHTFGHPCRIADIGAIANAWELPVVEDAAEAIGSLYREKHCGTFGEIGIFSFNGNKTITCGGGGAIVTDNDQLAARARHCTTTAKIDHPWEYDHDEVGYNYRMPGLNAALACAQLSRLDRLVNDKRKLAAAYETFFLDADLGQFVTEPGDSTSNYWLNTLLTGGTREQSLLLEKTRAADIMTRPIWRLMPDLAMYRDCQTGPLENARWLQARAVNLPSSARRESGK